MMSDSAHNASAQGFGFSVGTKTSDGGGRGSSRRSKVELSLGRSSNEARKGTADRILRTQEEEEMLWSPAPMETDTSGGFSVGKAVSPSGVARRGRRDRVIIPNVPIVSVVSSAGGSAARDTINEFRRKGNHAFKMKDYEAACTRYSNAIVTSLTLSPVERVEAGVSLPLLYCNRAAAYLALGKPSEAFEDCVAGVTEDPMYHRCRFRAATCLTRMGRFAEAREFVSLSLSNRNARGCDYDDGDADGEDDDGERIASEVAKRTAEIDEAESAFRAYAGALRDGSFTTMEAFKVAYKAMETHVPHSEALKASVVVAHVQMTDFSGADRLLDVVFSGSVGVTPPAWAGWCRVQTCFFKADTLQSCRNLEALDGLLKRASEASTDVSSVLTVPDASSIASMRQGLRSIQQLKERAHTQMQHRDFEGAIETYTSALAGPFLSPAMAAILLSNRAAAYQSLGQRALPLAGCCRAAALSPRVGNPYSRVGGLPVDLGLFLDAQRSIERAVAFAADTTQRASYLSSARSIAHHRQQQADHWLLLGLTPHGSSAAEAKKAYRKLALKLHPDKTSQAVKVEYQLGKDGCRLGTAEETQQEMLERATWVFKLLGEAQDALTG